MPLGPGQTFERYTVQELIGRGGMGEVWSALDTRLLRKVALKTIRPDRAEDMGEEAIARLFREARAAAAFAHPNAVAIYDLGEHDGTVFIVMELVRGTSLNAFANDQNVPLEVKLGWLAQIARALGAAHDAGVIHRDIKPSNIMITSEGSAKVLDFGLAKAQEASAEVLTKVGRLVGTMRYMAPELRIGAPADARTDVYAFGITAAELLTGTSPEATDKAPVFPRVPGMPPALVAMFDRTLADRQYRVPSMLEIAVGIESLQRRSHAVAPPVATDVLRASDPESSLRADESTEINIEWVLDEEPETGRREEPTTAVKSAATDGDRASQAFEKGFSKFAIGTGRYVVKLAASDAGSAQISLVPKVPGYARIDAGWVNTSRRVAELRTFDYVSLLYAHYFGTPPSFDRAQYDIFLTRTKHVLRTLGVGRYTLVGAPAELLPPR